VAKEVEHMGSIPPDYPVGFGRGRLNDDEARASLERLLALRRRAEEGEPCDLQGALEFAELANGVMSWVAQSQRLIMSLGEFAQLSVEQIRTLIITMLNLGLPIIQPEARHLLLEALHGLQAGYVSPLLQKTGRRRRTAPHQSAEVELRMLMWVRWQHGRGRKVAEVEAYLADRVGLTPQTIRKWPAELRKVYGTSCVQSVLERAEAVGRTEVSGSDPGNFFDLDPNRGFDLWSMSWRLDRDLDVLVDQRGVAIQKRGVSKRHSK
jgi:hypothetical protein